MAKKVTIYDIAEELHLSPSTVSRALTDSPLISSRTISKVKKAAEEMGYSEKNSSFHEASIITVIVPEINNHFYSKVISSIQEIIGDRYLVAIMCSNNSAQTEREIVDKLNPSQIKCAIISQSMDVKSCTYIEEAEKRGIKIILFNRIFYNGTCPKFMIDNYMDSYALTRHLVSTGRKRIAFAAKHYNCPIYKERIQAYKDVLMQNNLYFNPDYLIYSELTIEDTHEIIRRFINMKPRPDAIILPSYISTQQALSIIRINNLSVPQDLAIVSFDEDPECKYSTPSITGIERQLREIGEEIAKCALAICEKDGNFSGSMKVFSSNLIIRGSSFSCDSLN